MGTTLDQLYELRTNFRIIGLTGRTGSGCTQIAELLNEKWEDLKDNENIQPPQNQAKSIHDKKYKIVYDFCSENWKEYKIIHYKQVLLFLLIPYLKPPNANKIINEYFRKSKDDKIDKQTLDDIVLEINKTTEVYSTIIDSIKKIVKKLPNKLSKQNLIGLNKIFWGPKFNSLAQRLDTCIKKMG